MKKKRCWYTARRGRNAGRLFFDRFDQALSEDFASGNDCCGTTIRKVKAWVGDLNYKYFQYDQVEAPRQVGSVFKPVVYSAAIHQGTRLDAYYKNEQKTYPDMTTGPHAIRTTITRDITP